MKKMIFAVLAAFMVSLSFTSCSKSPEEKMVGYIEDMVSLMKDTHIKSLDDAKTFSEKAQKIKEDVEALEKSMGEDYKSSISEDEQKKLEERVGKAMEELMKEMERIQKEAAEAGVDASEIKGLF